MIFCRACGKEIHETAPACPHCGGLQNPASSLSAHKANDRSLWLSVASLVLGIISLLALLDDSGWDAETTLGLFIFAVAGLVPGIIALTKQGNYKGLAISGVVLSSVAIFAAIGIAIG